MNIPSLQEIRLNLSEKENFNAMVSFVNKLFNKQRKIDSSKLALQHLSDNKRNMWTKRIDDVITSPDNNYIPRDKDAGKIVGDKLVMHNGIKINPLSYGGYPMLNLLMKNKGVHEPQEERVFQEVLKVLPEKATMMELGSFWAFYSLWFCKVIPNAHCIMVEPNKKCLSEGKNNFKINGYRGKFIRAAIGNYNGSSKGKVRVETVDNLFVQNSINFCHILHADIQGQEYEMLKGAEQSINNIGYFFISSHSKELHNKSKKFLTDKNFKVITSVPPEGSYSYDGVLVAVNNNYPHKISSIQITHKNSVDEI